MASFAFVASLIDSAFESVSVTRSTWTRDLSNVVAEYVFPSLCFETRHEKNKRGLVLDAALMHDMTMLWATGKGYDRSHVFSLTGGVDGFPPEAFECPLLRRMAEETKDAHRTFRNMVKRMKPQLHRHILLPFTELLIDNVSLHELPRLIDTRNPYRFSSHQEPRIVETKTPYDEEIKQLTHDDEHAYMANEGPPDANEEKKRQHLRELQLSRTRWRAQKDPAFLVIQGDGRVRKIHCRPGSHGFTMFDLLCCLDQLHARGVGYRHDPKRLVIRGLSFDGLPIVGCVLPFDRPLDEVGLLTFMD